VVGATITTSLRLRMAWYWNRYCFFPQEVCASLICPVDTLLINVLDGGARAVAGIGRQRSGAIENADRLRHLAPFREPLPVPDSATLNCFPADRWCPPARYGAPSTGTVWSAMINALIGI